MPRFSDISHSMTPDDDMDDIPASIPQTQTKVDEAAEEQLEQELEELVGQKPVKKEKASRKQKQTKVENVEPSNGSKAQKKKDDEDEFDVEAIIDHKFDKKRCLYRVRWVGWSEADDTWEPEGHLLPESADLLAAYHSKIGGTPQPPKQVRKQPSKATLKSEDHQLSSAAEDNVANNEAGSPPSKRMKRSHRSGTSSNVIEPGSKDWKTEPLGAWQPADKGSWEDLVHEVETVERDDDGNLYAYIRFRNGKRSKVANNIYTSRCPRALVRFYEGHLSV